LAACEPFTQSHPNNSEILANFIWERAIYAENLIQYLGMKSVIDTAVEEASLGTAIEAKLAEVVKISSH
jgi:hypothetical protein